MTARSLLLCLWSVMIAACSSAVIQPTATHPIITRPVQIKEKDRPLISTPGSRYTITIEGRVTDSESGMVMPDSTILIVTETGSYGFWGGVFRISFADDTVANIRAEAPGCKAEGRQLEAHPKRNVTNQIEIPLRRTRGGLWPNSRMRENPRKCLEKLTG